MPNQDGMETIALVRDYSSDLPIIAMSFGSPTAGDFLQMTLDLGANRALKKPIDVGELLSTIKELLN